MQGFIVHKTRAHLFPVPSEATALPVFRKAPNARWVITWQMERLRPRLKTHARPVLLGVMAGTQIDRCDGSCVWFSTKSIHFLFQRISVSVLKLSVDFEATAKLQSYCF